MDAIEHQTYGVGTGNTVKEACKRVLSQCSKPPGGDGPNKSVVWAAAVVAATLTLTYL